VKLTKTLDRLFICHLSNNRFFVFSRTHTAGAVQQPRGQPLLDQVRAQKGRLRGPAHGQLPRVRGPLAR